MRKLATYFGVFTKTIVKTRLTLAQIFRPSSEFSFSSFLCFARERERNFLRVSHYVRFLCSVLILVSNENSLHPVENESRLSDVHSEVNADGRMHMEKSCEQSLASLMLFFLVFLYILSQI